MIRDLRKKFILVAMLSTLVVLTAIMGVVNISNYKEMLDRADDMTALLIQNDGQFPEEPVDEDSEIPDKPDNTKRTKSGTDTQTPPEKPQGDREHYSVETPFETRYFTVTADGDGEITDCDLERIAAVDEDTAEEYAKKISAKSGETGFEGIYRYRVTETDDGIKYVFLDCRREISNFRTVLVTTVSVSFLGLAAVLVLVVIFSRMVFRPVEESIQKQKRFITDASHELKTPLTIIDANTEVLEMESGESQWTKSTRKQIQRLTGLVQQLVTLSRLDEEKGLQDIAEFNLSEAIADSVQPYEALAQTKEKNLVLEIEKNTFSPQRRLIETESRRHGQEKPPERKLSRAEKNGKAHTNAAVKDLVDPKFFILHAPPPISDSPHRECWGRTSLLFYRKHPATGSSLPLLPFSGQHPEALRPGFP